MTPKQLEAFEEWFKRMRIDWDNPIVLNKGELKNLVNTILAVERVCEWKPTTSGAYMENPHTGDLELIGTMSFCPQCGGKIQVKEGARLTIQFGGEDERR